MKRSLYVLMALSLLPLCSFANQGGQSQTPGGTDSCGLGWQVTNKKTLMGTCTRGTTNGFIPPTFGMTSGTIGCDSHSFAKNEQTGLEYAVSNRDSLSLEMAAGTGEFLTGFAQALGCQDASSFGQKMQQRYESIFTSDKTSGIEMYENVKREIKNNGLSCRIG